MKHFDIIIIGFGKGGKTLAADLADSGKAVALIEQSEQMYGGACINIACIPTKVLVHESKQEKSDANNSYRQAITNVDQVTSKLRENNFEQLDSKDNVMIYTAKASFVSEEKILLQSETETIELTANRFIINTGSLPNIPPIEGLQNIDNVYTSTEMQKVNDLPEHLIIAGGGSIGLEFASIYANFGSKVTIVDSSEHFLTQFDNDIAMEVKSVLSKKNIEFIQNSKVVHVENHPTGLAIRYEGNDGGTGEVLGDTLLLATGRKPNTEGLQLEKAGIAISDDGAITVDEYLKTSQPHIWAIGDVNGGPQFTYISLDDYRIVHDQLIGEGNYNTNERGHIPTSLFIDPILSHVGITEKDAKIKAIEHEVVTMPANAIPRTKINKQPDGMLKVIVNTESKQILGATLFCATSSELINFIHLAMKAKVPYTEIRDMIFTHPTMMEAFNNLFKQLD